MSHALSAAGRALLTQAQANLAAEPRRTCDGCRCRLFGTGYYVQDGDTYCDTCAYALTSATVDGLFIAAPQTELPRLHEEPDTFAAELEAHLPELARAVRS